MPWAYDSEARAFFRLLAKTVGAAGAKAFLHQWSRDRCQAIIARTIHLMIASRHEVRLLYMRARRDIAQWEGKLFRALPFSVDFC